MGYIYSSLPEQNIFNNSIITPETSDTNLTNLTDQVNTNTNNITVLNTTTNQHTTDINTLQTTVNQLSSEGNNSETINNITTGLSSAVNRIEVLETTKTQMTNSLDTLTTTVNKNTSDIETLKSSIPSSPSSSVSTDIFSAIFGNVIGVMFIVGSTYFIYSDKRTGTGIYPVVVNSKNTIHLRAGVKVLITFSGPSRADYKFVIDATSSTTPTKWSLNLNGIYSNYTSIVFTPTYNGFTPTAIDVPPPLTTNTA